MTDRSRPDPSLAVALAAFGLALGVAYLLRFLLVENQAVAVACAARGTGLDCVLLESMVFTFHSLILGWFALAAALLALALPRLWTFLLALVPAAFALVLYNVELGATAVTLCLLATARGAARTAPA